jgi:hypothetical protein
MSQQPVRPTRRALSDIGVDVPDVGTPLHELSHPVVRASQQVPALHDCGGAERVVKLTDRVWFKCKTGRHRAVVTRLSEDDIGPELEPAWPEGRWWIGGCGIRRDDSYGDFYKAIEREASAGAKTISTDHLLPERWDVQRLVAEQGMAWLRHVQEMVVDIIATSLRSGRVVEAEYRQHRIKALVRAKDGNEAYLVIAAEGVPDPTVFALILGSVPGVSEKDWQPEPSDIADLTPGPGEVIWSTIFPPSVAATVLEMAPED